MEVHSITSKPKKIASASSQEGGAFCLFLPLGEYDIKVVSL